MEQVILHLLLEIRESEMEPVAQPTFSFLFSHVSQDHELVLPTGFSHLNLLNGVTPP